MYLWRIPRTTLEQWAVLAAVVDEGGFAQAAAALHRSQSAVSYAVARLQEALDVPLLVTRRPQSGADRRRARRLLQRARGRCCARLDTLGAAGAQPQAGLGEPN